jgi:hypothetical protein
VSDSAQMFSFARSRKTNFWIFPVEVFGSWPNSTVRGALKRARCSRQKAMISSAVPRGREPMQPAHVYRHHFCAIGAGQGVGKPGAGSLPAGASARVEGFLAYGPFAGAFRCATLDTRRLGALKDYFLVVAQPACDARHQAIQVIGGLLRQRGLP